MTWIDWSLLCAFIAGFLLFLYGANTYSVVAGYGGVYLSLGSIVTYLLTFVYKELKKPHSPN
ncbi:MAG: hypothetical protein LBI79_10725 [Nitrososphaerota archaeon]|jgi:hypothetical protein|nr:hypothetical protein [Nitrososphaerota archaeon]